METSNALQIEYSQLRDIVFIQDMDLNIVFVSPSVTEVFGYTCEEVYKLDMKEIIRKDSLKKASLAFEAALKQVRTGVNVYIPLLELEYIRKDGTTFWGEIQISFLRDKNGGLIGVQGILRNIDARRMTKDELRQIRIKFQSLFDISPQAIAFTQVSTGKLLYVNEKLCELTQNSKNDILGKDIAQLDLIPEENRKMLFKNLCKTGEVQGYEMDFKSKSGPTLNLQVFAKTIMIEDEWVIFTMFDDKTRENLLEYQFIQAQKMEALGTLAGGVAHDFNNLLMGIQGKVSLMLFKEADDHPHYAMLHDIQKNVQRCTELTRQLLGYARKENTEIAPLCLNDLIEETSNMFQRARKQINIKKELASNLFAVDADPVQVEQVLYNLYVNAADAMPKGGSLTLKTGNVTKNELVGRLYQPKKDNYVSFTITDTGCGMDKETLAHIFEPFFTTKEKGKGTGLGLASTYGIVKGHGGYIDVNSNPDKGTTFYVYLPASDKGVGYTDSPQLKVFQTRGTALLVDDETDVLDVASQMLEKVGFTVFSASCGADAIEIFKMQKDIIDIVILDVIMPGMGGGEVYDNLKKISKDVKVLLSSGYNVENHVADILSRGCAGFIQKPFTLEMLSEKINTLFRNSQTD
jgi:two-component system, cell cycle sensor histidine kinase and response regulator CckA